MAGRLIILGTTFLLALPGTSAGEVLEDLIILKNGDIARGQVIARSDTSLRLVSRDLQTVTIPKSSILRATRESISLRSPTKATLLSFIYFAGIGQWYNGEKLKGWGFFGWSFLSFYIPFSDLDTDNHSLRTRDKILLGSWGVSIVAGAVDAYFSARRINRERYGPLYESGRPKLTFLVAPASRQNWRPGARLAYRF